MAVPHPLPPPRVATVAGFGSEGFVMFLVVREIEKRREAQRQATKLNFEKSCWFDFRKFAVVIILLFYCFRVGCVTNNGR